MRQTDILCMQKDNNKTAQVIADRHKTSRVAGCFLTFLTDWLRPEEPMAPGAGQQNLVRKLYTFLNEYKKMRLCDSLESDLIASFFYENVFLLRKKPFYRMNNKVNK